MKFSKEGHLEITLQFSLIRRKIEFPFSEHILNIIY